MGERSAATAIRELQADAQDLLGTVRRQARRAYVVEISGTPKAGKSSSIAMVHSFFRACGWRVEVLRETAAACPLPMKGHFFFNTWTTTTMLAGLLEAVDSGFDLVIIDRGLFDAIVWLELQKRRGQVSQQEGEAFSNFVLLDRWRKLIDASFVMRVSPDVAMAREHLDRLVQRAGTIMNEASLTSFNATLDECESLYRDAFALFDIDASKTDRKETAAALVQELLTRIRAWVDPDIVGVDRSAIEAIVGKQGGPIQWKAWDQLSKAVTTRKRSDAESDGGWVQLMACGVMCFEGGVFVFDRADKDKINRYGRSAIWRSQHVEAKDLTEARDPAWIASELRRRLADTLYVEVGLSEPAPLGIVWDPTTEPQHAAMVFEVSVESQSVADTLAEKEFKTSGRRNLIVSRFVPLSQLSSAHEDLEIWSRMILDAAWLSS